jgi:PAS domain S-box-containing protein
MTEAPSTSPPVVLLVDDDPRNVLALEAILEGTGYRLLTATSGAEALELAVRESPTVVLLDVLMPGMDGYEVAGHLKSITKTRDIPIVFLTALATDVRFIYRAYDVGAVDYLIKPLDPEVVRRKVAVLVDLVRQRQEIERQARALREAERREHALRVAELRMASDRRYRKLVEGIDHAIGWTMDEAERFTFVSRRASKILGYSLEQISEPGFWTARTHPEDVDGVLEMFRRARAEGIELTCNHRLVHADGRVLWFHTGVSVDSGMDGEAVELHGISVDVTDIKRAHEDTQRAMRFREEIIAIVAHDLRNPLHTINSCAEMLRVTAEETQDARGKKGARAIGRAVEHMERIVEDLLDFALIQAGRVTITPVPIAASALVGECLEMFEPIAKTRRLELRQRFGDPLTVSGERHRLLQILSNLVGNAIKFTPDGGTIVVGCERQGADAMFTISDSGPGMSEADASRMWERYWRARPTEAGAPPGLGLGLSIAEGLVAAHGGRIWAHSTVGEGTTLYFTIPLADAEPDPAARG